MERSHRFGSEGWFCKVFNRKDESGFAAHLLGHSPLRERKAVAGAAKCVFRAADMAEARRQRDAFVETFAKRAPKAVTKAVTCLKEALDDATAVMCLPEKHRKRLRSTNMQECER